MKWTLEEYNEATKTLSIQCLGPFLGIRIKTTHQCLKCDVIFEAFPDNVRRGKSKCPMCSSGRMHLTTELYNGLVANRKIVLVEPFRTQLIKTRHACLACTYEWSPTPDSVLSGHGCPACSKDQADSGWKHRTEVKVGKRTVHLQGYEPQALTYLQSVGCNINKLLFNTNEGKPTFKYKFSRKDCLYIPDFYYPPKNRVVEVKSSWTLVQTLDIFRKNCAKARSVLRKGYDFKLLVISESGKLIKMPKDWYLMRFAEVKGILALKRLA